MSNWQNHRAQNSNSGPNYRNNSNGQGQQEEKREKKWYRIAPLWFNEEKGTYTGQGFRVGRDRNGEPVEPHCAELASLGQALVALSQGWPLRMMEIPQEKRRQNGPTHELMAIRQFEDQGDYERRQNSDDVPF